jgi:hypothetical protein
MNPEGTFISATVEADGDVPGSSFFLQEEEEINVMNNNNSEKKLNEVRFFIKLFFMGG